MARRMLMSDVTLRSLRRADREEDDAIGEAEARSLISEQYGELYSIVAESGLRYFETTATITTTGAASYDEPENHMGTVLVDQVVNAAGQRRELIELMPGEQVRWSGMTGTAQRYALIDDQICFYPTPPAGQTYEISYIAQPPDLTDYLGTDVIDVVNPAGEAFLIWGSAVKFLVKSDSDTTVFERHREMARAQLIEWALLRAFEQPRRRVMAATACDDYGYPFDQADWRFR